MYYFYNQRKQEMSTFIGEYHVKVDAKGRIMLPAAFKKQLSEASHDTFVAKKDIYENCLVLYPMEEWERQNQLIKANTNPYNSEHNRFVREFYKGAAEVALDGNNRILIPRRLLDEVGVSDEMVLAGQHGKIECWAKSSYGQLNPAEFAKLAEKIMGGPLNDIQP
jgi:MraZ protein